MAVTVTAFKTKIDELVVLIEAEDWAAAWTKYAACEALNAGIEAEVSDEGARIRRREQLVGIRLALQAAETSSGRGSNRKRLVTGRTNYSSNGSSGRRSSH